MNLSYFLQTAFKPVFNVRKPEADHYIECDCNDEPVRIVEPIRPGYVYYQPEGLKTIAQYKPLISATHLLIAGTTGAGKSVCLNGIIYSMLGQYSPHQVSFVLIDPKRVELSAYKNLPHTINYTHDSYEADSFLQDVIDIIEDRYSALDRMSSKQWQGNKIYIIIDELADLLIGPNGKSIKLSLQKILQIGRAAGVSVIACTQAPNRTIIPANLTLNFTDRIALRCISSIESRQIVQVAGAEKLPQFGKGLYLSPRGLSSITIPMIAESELQDRIDYWSGI